MNLAKPFKIWFSGILIVLLMLFAAGVSDEDPRYQRIRNALNKFTNIYQQQKIYLHLDKSIYYGGDIIWIKAYLVNGMNHLPDTLSTNLYVELISPLQSRVEIKRFQMFYGFGIGDFTLSDTLPEGLYQIRAYTNWMQNFDADFYFKKNFQIVNPGYTKLISPRQARVNKKELDTRLKQEDDLDIQFMPEGGSLVNGLESVVAFKAINKLGKGIDIDGNIIDDRGNIITSFSSFYKGIGTFNLQPEDDRKYYSIIKLANKDIKTPLPQTLDLGVVLHAEQNRNMIKIYVRSNKFRTNDRQANEIILVGQVGGQLYYHTILHSEGGQAEVDIMKNIFPTGIIQFTAFSGRGEPLAERLVFNNRSDLMRILFNASDSVTDKGTKVILRINTADVNLNPVSANLSLAVTRNNEEMSSTNNENIYSTLLLTSDLKGYVEDPSDYFKDQTPSTVKALDNLMLTNGWRRFDWNKILAGEYPDIHYHEEKGITVSGRITRDFFDIPLKNCKVQLSVMDKYNDVFTQYSSNKGYFMFENLIYYDTVSIKIEAWKPNGRKNLLILLPEEKLNEISGFQGDYTLTTFSERDQKSYRTEKYKEARKAYYEEQERLKEERKNLPITLYGEPDAVLLAKDLPKGTFNILEAMTGRIPGVSISGDQVVIRGPSTFFGSNQPLFLIDGVPVEDVEAVKSIPITDIDRVEVLKGPSAAIYGIRGANGIIAIYTKRGFYIRRGVIEFNMLGYNTPRIFYEPKYLPENEPQRNYTQLWEPVIQTNTSGKAEIVFDKPSIQGDYRFIFEGISFGGHVGYAETVISNQ
jgi:TonB-dependent SusC/RagA subfamily outer membrane receptor